MWWYLRVRRWCAWWAATCRRRLLRRVVARAVRGPSLLRHVHHVSSAARAAGCPARHTYVSSARNLVLYHYGTTILLGYFSKN